MQYGDGTPTVVDDRVLARVAALHDVVRTTGHSFTVTFTNNLNGQAGQTTIWLNPAIDLHAVYESEPDPIDHHELTELTALGLALGDVTL